MGAWKHGSMEGKGKGREEQPRTRHAAVRASMFCFFVKAQGEKTTENGAIVASCGGFESVSVGPKKAKCKVGKRGQRGQEEGAKGGRNSQLARDFFFPLPSPLHTPFLIPATHWFFILTSVISH